MRKVVLVVSVLATACAGEGAPPPANSEAQTLEAILSEPEPVEPLTTQFEPTQPETVSEPEPEFVGEVRTTSPEELGSSWRQGCPVSVEDLRWMELTHWDYEGQVATGDLIVHVDHVDDLLQVFARLFEAEFPIQAMQAITVFDADDNASMRANNSSAFNCRLISRTSRWSQHAYGGAVDINPLVNPWVRGSQVDPPEGADYVDRSTEAVGMIRPGDVVTQAFAEIGWGWGGDWKSAKDYQHFSHNGR